MNAYFIIAAAVTGGLVGASIERGNCAAKELSAQRKSAMVLVEAQRAADDARQRNDELSGRINGQIHEEQQRALVAHSEITGLIDDIGRLRRESAKNRGRSCSMPSKTNDTAGVAGIQHTGTGVFHDPVPIYLERLQEDSRRADEVAGALRACMVLLQLP